MDNVNLKFVEENDEKNICTPFNSGVINVHLKFEQGARISGSKSSKATSKFAGTHKVIKTNIKGLVHFQPYRVILYEEYVLTEAMF